LPAAAPSALGRRMGPKCIIADNAAETIASSDAKVDRAGSCTLEVRRRLSFACLE
jgi:hypothetical protein